MDASHVPKSGKQTYGLGKFYSGCLGRAVKGLEISELALIDRDSRQAFSFSSRQTVDEVGKTRPEVYAEHVKDCAETLPPELNYLLVDGYYTKKHFVDEVCALERALELVGKLRCTLTCFTYTGALTQAKAVLNAMTARPTSTT